MIRTACAALAGMLTGTGLVAALLTVLVPAVQRLLAPPLLQVEPWVLTLSLVLGACAGALAGALAGLAGTLSAALRARHPPRRPLPPRPARTPPLEL